jgi:hypothetical protein
MAKSILTPFTFTTGGNSITSAAIGSIPLVLKGASGQTASLQEWQSSSGTMLARVNADGTFQSPSIGINAVAAGYTAALSINTGTSTVGGIVVRGVSSQSANLTEWQTSTPTTVASISSAGALTATGLTTTAAINLNYASPTIASNNASAASIFTSTVTGVTIGSSTIRTTAFPADATTATATAGVGYMGIPQNSTTTGSYTIVAGDAGKHIFASASRTVTIPANSSVAFPIGTTITFISGVGATMTIQITTDTMYLAGTGSTGNRTLAAHGIATAVKTTSGTWLISGNGLT